MIEHEADVAVLGAGFGGSLCALIAQRLGLRPVLIERHLHPRFALGESSTPIANLVMGALADRYGLPQLKPLTRYGTWVATYPNVGRGLKRGFSYFHHQAGEHFKPREDHANELLVAANPDAERGDTHWLRADFDHFLVRQVQKAGIPYLDQTELVRLEARGPWRLLARRHDEEIKITAGFMIDASGSGAAMAQMIGIPNDPSAMHTHSRAVYSHFRNVRGWQDIYTGRGGKAADHPFPCDEAALHHVFDGGWMWVLRFDNGVTSAGFSLDCTRFPVEEGITPLAEWNALLERYPSIKAQFDGALPIMPVRRSPRLQRRLTRAAGADWAMLPTTAGFVDALHSTGNAHTLTGVQRIMAILRDWDRRDERSGALRRYEEEVLAEVDIIDRLVHGCYRSFHCFPRMVAFSMLYFAAATYNEHLFRKAMPRRLGGFLLSGDDRFRDLVVQAHEILCLETEKSYGHPGTDHDFCENIARAIMPYNVAGLCDPAKRNLYPFLELL